MPPSAITAGTASLILAGTNTLGEVRFVQRVRLTIDGPKGGWHPQADQRRHGRRLRAATGSNRWPASVGRRAGNRPQRLGGDRIRHLGVHRIDHPDTNPQSTVALSSAEMTIGCKARLTGR